VSEPILSTRDVVKVYAGFTALDGVSLDVTEGAIHAIIGPNGAGKTTFFNLLSGLLPPSEGRVFYRERDITDVPAYERARLGISRSFQITNIFRHLSVYENVRLAVQAVHDGKANFFLPTARMGRLSERTEEVLHDIGLFDARDAQAENLSHGDQRRLEIGLVIARNPPVLLLDEPLAGMSPAETQATVDLITRISPARTILHVEHDIDVVMSISTTITVFQTGGVLAVGTPAEIRANETVQRAYLGEIV
jgi:branched-chain amino acid transport system ATP-binding protein